MNVSSIPPMKKLPEKKYFKIGEVADLVGVEPHVLRYWETQFPQLRPHKARSGHRLYRRREVETLLVIRELLHVQRFTIAGARQALRQPGGASSLIPRFFGEGVHADGNESAPPTLVPQDASATDPNGASEVEIEAVGVDDDDELREALERETAEQVARTSGRGRTLVEVEVGPESVAPVQRAPVQLTPVRALAPAKNRGLLESALGDARAILAILDREDAHRRMHV